MAERLDCRVRTTVGGVRLSGYYSSSIVSGRESISTKLSRSVASKPVTVLSRISVMYRSTRLLKAVSTLPCQLCYREHETQAAHANWGVYGKGMGQKAHDCFVAALCQSCHREIDQGSKLSGDERREQWETAFRRTLLELFNQGLVNVR